MRIALYLLVAILGVLALALTIFGLRQLVWRLARPASYFLHHAANRQGVSGAKCIVHLYKRYGEVRATELLLSAVWRRLDMADATVLVGTREGYLDRLRQFRTLMRSVTIGLRDLDFDRQLFPRLRDLIYPVYLRQPRTVEQVTRVYRDSGEIVSDQARVVDNPALEAFAAVVNDLS